MCMPFSSPCARLCTCNTFLHKCGCPGPGGWPGVAGPVTRAPTLHRRRCELGRLVPYPPPSAPAPPTAVVMAGRVMLTTLRCFFAACSLPEPGRGTAPTPGGACHDNDHWSSRRPRDRWLGRERRRGFVHADSASREHTDPCVFLKKNAHIL